MAFLAAIKGLREKDKAKEKALESPWDKFQGNVVRVRIANDCKCLACQNLHLVMLVKCMTKGKRLKLSNRFSRFPSFPSSLEAEWKLEGPAEKEQTA